MKGFWKQCKEESAKFWDPIFSRNYQKFFHKFWVDVKIFWGIIEKLWKNLGNSEEIKEKF